MFLKSKVRNVALVYSGVSARAKLWCLLSFPAIETALLGTFRRSKKHLAGQLAFPTPKYAHVPVRSLGASVRVKASDHLRTWTWTIGSRIIMRERVLTPQLSLGAGAQ